MIRCQLTFRTRSEGPRLPTNGLVSAHQVCPCDTSDGETGSRCVRPYEAETFTSIGGGTGQGAWGVIPAHINDQLRGFFPGCAYHLGVLVAAGSPYFEARMAQYMTYGQAMGSFAFLVLLLGALVIWLGPEAHGADFGRGPAP